MKIHKLNNSTKNIFRIINICLIFLFLFQNFNFYILVANAKTEELQKNSNKNQIQEGINNEDFVPGEVIIKYKDEKISLQDNSGRQEAASLAASKKLEKLENFELGNISLLKIKDGKSVEEKIKELEKDEKVEYAEPNFIRYPASIDTNDTSKNELWGLDNTGQSVNGTAGTIDADIDAPEAWSAYTVNNDVIVAVIDSGVAYNHPDLVNSMWDGTSCKDENGNFLGGCTHGYDFEDEDKNPAPTSSSHGTHIAGIIAATRNNSSGILGISPNTKIMALKNDLTTAQLIRAIDFAIQNGAKIINASYTGLSFSQAEYDAINRFRDASGIVVGAAGNQGKNNESSHSYPSDYDLDNIISVAATDQNDELADFSNYGLNSVDVGAPGTSIYSTISDSIVLDGDFDDLIAPGIPDGWVKGGINNKWATFDIGAGVPEIVLYGDLSIPYDNNANSTITSPIYDLSTTQGATFDFFTACDTEYDSEFWRDYMTLEFTNDEVNFSEFRRWDEYDLDPINSSGSAWASFTNTIPEEYLTDQFRFRFRWVTNSSINDFDGCFVDEITITKYGDGSDEQYGFKNGTSMATPYVAGLVALLWGVDQNLTPEQVKAAILNSGDTLPGLVDKTTTGKRINAYNALASIDDDKLINSFDFSNPAVIGVINESNHTISLQVPYGTDVSSIIPTIDIDGDSINPSSGFAQDFTNPVVYTVTAVNGSTQEYTVTVTIAPASTIATISSDQYDISSTEISNVPFNTPKATFLAELSKNEPNQTWDDSDLNDPVEDGDTLTVTAQDGTTVKTYLIKVNANPQIAILNSEVNRYKTAYLKQKQYTDNLRKGVIKLRAAFEKQKAYAEKWKACSLGSSFTSSSLILGQNNASKKVNDFKIQSTISNLTADLNRYKTAYIKQKQYTDNLRKGVITLRAAFEKQKAYAEKWKASCSS